MNGGGRRRLGTELRGGGLGLGVSGFGLRLRVCMCVCWRHRSFGGGGRKHIFALADTRMAKLTLATWSSLLRVCWENSA